MESRAEGAEGDRLSPEDISEIMMDRVDNLMRIVYGEGSEHIKEIDEVRRSVTQMIAEQMEGSEGKLLEWENKVGKNVS